MPEFNFHHAAVVTGDLERTIAFYRDNLGFIEERRLEVAEMKMRICYLDRNGFRIEILEQSGVTSTGLKHLAFTTGDIDSAHAAFKEAGAGLLHDRVQESAGMRLFFLRGPEGELLEIMEG